MAAVPLPSVDNAVQSRVKALVIQLRLGLQALIVHFKSHGSFIRDKTTVLIDTMVLGKMQSLTATDPQVR